MVDLNTDTKGDVVLAAEKVKSGNTNDHAYGSCPQEEGDGNTGGERASKVTADDIRRSYTVRKARNDLVTQTWVYLVLRPLSFYITPLFIRMKWNANKVTLLGLMPLLASAGCMLMGATHNLYFIAGAALLNLWFMMDVIDGNIARYEKRANRFGELLDWLIGMIASVAIPLSIGLGLSQGIYNYRLFGFVIEIEGWVWLVAGVVVVVAELFRNVTSLRARQIMELGSPAMAEGGIKLRELIPRAFVSFQKPLMLIAAIIGWMDVFLAVSALFSLVTMFGVIMSVMCKARLADNSGGNPNDDSGYDSDIRKCRID